MIRAAISAAVEGLVLQWRVAQIISISAVVVLLGAVGYSAVELIAQQRALSSINRETMWTSVQLQREFLRLQNAIGLHAVAPEQSTAEDVRLQFELFWSRVPIALEHPSGLRALSDPSLVDGIRALEAALPSLETALSAYLTAPDGDPTDVLVALDRWSIPINDAVRLAAHDDNTNEVLDQLLEENVHGLSAAFIALMAALVLIGRLMLELSRVVDLRRAALAATDKAEEAKARLVTAIETLDDGFLLIDADGFLAHANTGVASIFPELEQVTPGELVGPWIRHSVPHLVLEEGTTVQSLPSGRRVVSLVATTPDGGILGVYRDVTEQEKQSEERRLLSEQLHQAQKQEALGRLAGGIAHDFNNILGAIKGFAALLVEDMPKDGEASSFAEQIVLASDRASGLVKRILSFSRPQTGDLEPNDLSALVNETLSMLKAGLSPATILTYDPPTGPVMVMMDTTQIGQVLVNLIVNARDALPVLGGQVDVVVESDPDLEAEMALFSRPLPEDVSSPLRINEEADGTLVAWFGVLDPARSCVRLSVRDNGSGMDRETVERAFDPFFTTKGHGKGSGLGLSTVMGIVMAHDGAVRLETSMARGTRFQLLLPSAVEPVDEKAVRSTPDAVAIPGETILIVDDEPDLLTVMQTGLERRGWSVVVADSAMQALDRLEGVDAMITDQTMPGHNGTELIRCVTLVRPELPILLCTGHGAVNSEEEATDIGADGFLRKPVDLGELAHLLRDRIDRRNRGREGVPHV